MCSRCKKNREFVDGATRFSKSEVPVGFDSDGAVLERAVNSPLGPVLDDLYPERTGCGLLLL